MKYNRLIVLILLFIFIGGIFFVARKNPQETEQSVLPVFIRVRYICQDAYIDTGFSDGQVAIVLSDGREYTLQETIAGSSDVRYSNGEVTLWITGDTANLEESGETTLSDCKDQSK